jgi:hypothetical protein
MQHLADRIARDHPRRPPYASETVTWLELFYDLVMVAAIIVFSHSLSVQPTWEIALKTLVIFTVLWWVWLITTLLVNADPSTNTLRRGLLFAQMLTMVLLIIVGSHDEIPWRPSSERCSSSLPPSTRSPDRRGMTSRRSPPRGAIPSWSLPSWRRFRGMYRWKRHGCCGR